LKGYMTPRELVWKGNPNPVKKEKKGKETKEVKGGEKGVKGDANPTEEKKIES
jgi:tryptophanyl-tRNA synthetase